MKRKNSLLINYSAIALIMVLSLSFMNEMTWAQTTSAYNKEVSKDVDSIATYPGGMSAMMKYLSQNVRLPKTGEIDLSQGRIILGFIINEKGAIEQIEMLRGFTNSAFNEHVIKIIQEMPRWNPAYRNGKAVNSYYKLPINIKFSE